MLWTKGYPFDNKHARIEALEGPILHPSSSDPLVLSADQAKGLALACSSAVFIGSSFIIKKKGLRVAGANGVRAGIGGYSYLVEPLWWAGMLTMIVGEIANFAAYAFAPAILVTPLGALSIIVSAVLAHIMLNERLNIFGILGCVLCIVGSMTIVLHAPEEREITSLLQVWNMALQPGFLLYCLVATAIILYLIVSVAPNHGNSNVFVYLAICSLVGSLSVMSVKALGIALKLTFQGQNQFVFIETYFCILVVAICVVTQINYLNRALDMFNTAIVSPIYYVMFTLLTITASLIMFQEPQTGTQIMTEGCGFTTIVIGTFLLHATRELDISLSDLTQLLRAPPPGSQSAVRFSAMEMGRLQ
ncbi:g6600 [Coccomyxa elongata]